MDGLTHPKVSQIWLLALIAMACLAATVHAASSTRGQIPHIFAVVPSFGSVEGGSRISIKGMGFAQAGLFTNRAVFIGGERCAEIPYYTTDTEIVCITPKCTTPECLSSPTWGSAIAVSLDVYVQTVEGVLGQSATFSYNGGYTPAVYKMSHVSRGSAPGFVQGFLASDQLASMTIKFQGNMADLGEAEPGQLNPNALSMWSSSTNVLYQAPKDMSAGFYNLSLTLALTEDQTTDGQAHASGLARMFPKQKAYSSWDASYGYNFMSSLSGTAYSVCVQPVLAKVTPALGSLVGGTLLTLRGSGFSKDASLLTVLVGGRPCAVESADMETITCRTARDEETLSQAHNQIVRDAQGLPYFNHAFQANSSRSYGSPGWWIRMWNSTSYNANRMNARNFVQSMGWKGDMQFSLSSFMSDWPGKLNYISAASWDPAIFAADLSTNLLAPFTGIYQFYMTSDDSGNLYGRRAGEAEKLLLTTSYSGRGDYHTNPSAKKSKMVYLQRGERYPLRARLVNTGGPDYIEIGMKILPNYTSDGLLWDDAHPATADPSLPAYNLSSNVFRHHHTLEDIQIISLSMAYRQEQQLVVITGIDDGTFSLVLQNSVATDPLPVTASNSEIANALTNAAVQIPSQSRECTYFGVSKTLGNGGKNIFITVTFNVDNTLPMTSLDVFTGSLSGNNVAYNVSLVRPHSIIPVGAFDLTLLNPISGLLHTAPVPFNADPDLFRNIIQTIDHDFTVDVSRAGSAYSGYTWTVTFLTPRGNIDILQVNVTGITAEAATSNVKKVENGSESSFWFMPIPVWLTEVPLLLATEQKVNSNVEVFVRSDSTGDVLKAACDDGMGFADPAASFFNGREETCAFHFASLATALVSSFKKFKIDALQTGVEIFGSAFIKPGPFGLPAPVTVDLDQHNCNITFINNTFIACTVSSVPWGIHVPKVSLSGYGDAMVVTNASLDFQQSIYAVHPSVGSIAGGQIVTIDGRGFRSNATVTIGDRICEVISWSSSQIQCRTPAAPSFATFRPSGRPSAKPTITPPTVSPSGFPTFSPTVQETDAVGVPSMEPTFNPTADASEVATEFASGESGDVQTNSFTELNMLFNGRRRLTEVSNIFQLLVDAQGAVDEETTNYQYSDHDTPVVQHISPDQLSSATTSNLTFQGIMLDGMNVSVSVGEQACEHVRWHDGELSCVLRRSSTLKATATLPVKIYVPNRGYAASQHDLTVLPSMVRGFELSSVAPSNGSVLGGNTLFLTGFGFLPNQTTRHTVTLTRMGLSGPSEYDDMLTALGFPPNTTYAAYDRINCTVTSVWFTGLICDLPTHSQKVYPDAAYDVQVVVNGVTAGCGNEDGCFYTQSLLRTPVISAESSILSISPNGEYLVSIDVEGNILDGLLSAAASTGAAPLKVTVAALACFVQNISSSNITFSTPPLPAGNHVIHVNMNTVGEAMSSAIIAVPNIIASLEFATTVGSLAGGTHAVLMGSGFSSNCQENVVALNVSWAGAYSLVTVQEYTACSTNTLRFITPTVLPVLGSSLRRTLFAETEVNVIVHTLSIQVHPAQAAAVASDEVAVTGFYFALGATPLIKTNHSAGFAGDFLQVLTMSHVDYTNPNSGYPVQIGGAACLYATNLNVDALLHSSATAYPTYHFHAFSCVIPALSARLLPYEVRLDMQPFGYAIFNDTAYFQMPAFTSLFSAGAMSPQVAISSVYGGKILQVHGQGFSASTKVSVCGLDCPMVAGTVSNYGSLKCQLPKHMTTEAVEQINSNGWNIDMIEEAIGGSFFSSVSPASTVLVNLNDSSYETYFSHDSKTCYVGLTLPVGTVARPYRMRYYPRIQNARFFGPFVFEGKKAGANQYTLLGTGNGANEGWNFIDATGANSTSWYSAFRFRAMDTSATTSRCALAELKFLATVASSNQTCNVKVISPEANKTLTIGQVSYSMNQNATPMVSSLSPNNGSALGGTVVTIRGQGFLAAGGDISSVDVQFSGIPCSVLSLTNTAITCMTNARSPDKVAIPTTRVLVNDRGLALVEDDVHFLYIDKWSALTSWKNQEPPVDGDIVWIPDGQVILLDQDTPWLTFLLVEGSLYFDRTKDLKVDSFYIFVLGGYMEVGTAAEPFEKHVEITIWGDRFKTIEIPFIGSKVIAVGDRNLPRMQMVPGMHMPGRDKGQLEVHGKKRLRTWTKVAQTAPAGTNYVITSEPIDYVAGEVVIVNGNSQQGMGDSYEIMVVLQTSSDGHNVSFTAPLAFTHESKIVYVEGRRIDMRFEIGLISRNVIIQGDNSTSDGQLFGVHTIAMMSGIYRIENTEVRRCGQAFNFGRYCTHSHMAGFMESSYVKANSIHHSYQRAVTTHRTSDWEVRDNVAFDIQGHAYFVEDGNEMRNSITGNLGIMIRRSSALLKSDMKPAVFWTTTPYNYWRDNVGTHSAAFGFWFELPGELDNLCPSSMPLGEFKNNTFHSNGDIGLRIYPIWTPLKVPCDERSAPAPQYLQDLLSYHNGGNGLFSKRHGDLHHLRPTFVENGGDDVSIEIFDRVPYTMDPTIMGALFIGTLAPGFSETNSVGKRAIFGPQGEYFYVKNSTFVNYGSGGAITGCNSCLSGSEMNQGGFTTRFADVKFVKTKMRYIWSPTDKEILWDLDGSFAGVKDSMVTKFYHHIDWPECTRLSMQEFENGIRCGGVNSSSARIRRMQLEKVTPSQLSYTDILVRSEVGMDSFYFLPLDTYGWVFPLVTGPNKTYSMEWADAGISAYTFNYTLGRVAYLYETINNSHIDETVKMRFTPNFWDYDPYSFDVTYNKKKKIASLNNTLTLKTVGQAEYKNRTIDVMVTNRGASVAADPMFGVAVSARLCPPQGCPVPPVPAIGVPLLWSKTASWPSKKLPKVGEKVVIDADRWIVLDISPPKLATIVVYGKLSFLSNASHPLNLTLTAQNIQVFGSFEITGAVNSTTAPYNNTNLPFEGNATVVIYGNKGSSLPIIMREGVFVGSKVIAVAGTMVAWGQDKVASWMRLNQTLSAGSNSLVLPTTLPWSVGDEVVFSPTGYFDSAGIAWSKKTAAGKRGSADEVRMIRQITVTDFSTTILLNKPLNHTHLCEELRGVIFCGAVGVLTRNVRFLSADSENPAISSYGFGANIHVLDMPALSPPRYGTLQMNNVELKNFGKVNSDHYAVAMAYSNHQHQPSSITNCAFNGGYNLAMRVANSYNLTFAGNVASGNWGGGVLLEASNAAFVVEGNLVIGTRQLPSVLLSSFPWLRPVACFSIHSPSGLVRNNLAAGSEDEGFSVAMAMFVAPPSMRSICSVTRTKGYTYSALLNNYGNAQFYNNEAVACRTGLSAVAMYPGETGAEDCAIIDGLVAWRNAHAGIQAMDVASHLLISRALLAENFIGMNLHFYKTSSTAFSGVVQSVIIGSLGSQGTCQDLSDSAYLNGQQCQAFTDTDPLGLSTSCGSVLGSLYRRVGILVPQYTNKPRTCAIAGRFEECDPPNTPDRLCQLPWDKRYGLPIDIVYAELHIHDTTFEGFESRSYDNTSMLSTGSSCIPSLLTDKSSAIAYNPSQVDMQPTMITSGLVFLDTDRAARIGHDLGHWATELDCAFRPCSGHNMMIIHDADGSLTDLGSPGQLVYDNPEYGSPYPSCFEAASMDDGLFFCPTVSGDYNASFRQYSAVWRDWGPQILQPIIISRLFGSDDNRTFASYGPIDDSCAKRFYFSRFNMLFATGMVNKVRATGTTPSEWIIRWDAPSATDVAVVEFFITQSQAVNVFVSDNPNGGFEQVPKITRYPTMSDPAGTNMRDPQNRFLAVTIRGGTKNYYRFNIIPVAAVTIKMEMTLAQFVSDTFIANMAMLLRISPSRIKITDVRQGSVIADFDISPAVSVANSTSAYVGQITELQQLTANLSTTIETGEIQTALNVTVSQVFATPPVTPVILNETMDIAENTTFNVTQFRSALVSLNTPVSLVLLTYPTSFPTSQPSMQPTQRPSGLPTAQPSGQPSGQPSSEPTSPTGQPSGQPTLEPTGSPTSQPSTQPSGQPSGQPSRQPSSQPSRQPSRQPSSQPSRQPTNQPTMQPSRQPTRQPSMQPSGQPTVEPSRQPSARPSSQPSRQPSSQPSRQPSRQPSGQPSRQPTSRPSSQPSAHPSTQPSRQPSSQPSRQPSVQPSSRPSSQPSGQPTAVPSTQPSIQPSMQPSSQPSKQPSGQPSRQPSMQPSGQPSRQPTAQPSRQPSAQPSQQPSRQPSSQPTGIPSGQPSMQPSRQPSAQPSSQPSMQPSAQPSVQPSAQPSGQPSMQPSMQPSNQPSEQPSSQPSEQPTMQPSGQPSMQPSNQPSVQPSGQPSSQPSAQPSSQPSTQPSMQPSSQPSSQPSMQPSSQPTVQPSGQPTCQPSMQPSMQPSGQPTEQPSTQPSMQPSVQPTGQPTGVPSSQPSMQPSAQPSTQPSDQPSAQPSMQPTTQPSTQPTMQPSTQPSDQPSRQPTSQPSGQPSGQPSSQPSMQPSAQPSDQPSAQPSSQPTEQPSTQPSEQPTGQPSNQPSSQPSIQPSTQPSMQPSVQPSSQPSRQPSAQPSMQPSGQPTSLPTVQPSSQPSIQPSTQPTQQPSCQPTDQPSVQPSTQPSTQPSVQPSRQPSEQPSAQPSTQPSRQPSLQPTEQPSVQPSAQPTSFPTVQPSTQPSSRPTNQPSTQPSAQPSEQPSEQPSGQPSSQPSMQPSHQPTEQPSGQPSGRPTARPTEQPSTHPSEQPSSQPSLQPNNAPTSQPSAQPTVSGGNTIKNYTIVSFSCDQTISGCDATAFSNDASAKAALISTIATSSSSTGLTPVVKLTSIAASSAVARKAAVQAAGLQVKYTITLTMNSGSSTPAVVYTAFTDDLKASISSGSFLTTLTSHGLAVFANANVSLAGLSVGAYSVDIEIVDSSSDDDPKPRLGLVIGLPIGLFALLVICLFYFYITRKPVGSTVIPVKGSKVVPLRDDNMDGFHDLERLDTPINAELVGKPGATPGQTGSRFHFEEEPGQDPDDLPMRPEAPPVVRKFSAAEAEALMEMDAKPPSAQT